MATQIVIFNEEAIKIDDSFHIDWADKGNAWQAEWIPNTVHVVIWNALLGQKQPLQQVTCYVMVQPYQEQPMQNYLL